ncbi:MAG: hypothetical protein GX020_07210, partial [Firmicutes bacterium]|nr:hypothetical protein [Bacillota bacterium]
MKRVGAFLVFLLCFFWLFSGCSLLSTEPNLWETIDHTHPDSKFGGIMWWPVQSEQALMGSKTYSESRHSFAEFEFEGSAVRWIGTKGPTKGIADIYLNGEIVFEGLDTYSPTTEYQQVIAELFNLEPGKNVLRINVTGKKNPKSRGANVTIDGFQYIPTGKRAIELAEDILTSEYGEVFAKRAPEAVIKLRSKIEVARQRLATEVSKDEELTIVRDLKLAREEFEQQLVAGGVVGKISFGTGRWDI